MRKFKTTIPTGQGLKFFDKYLETELSDELWTAIESIYTEVSSDTEEGYIIKGGSVTGSSPSAQIDDSIVVLNGKVLRLTATTGQTYPFYIQEATTVEINGDFGDSSSQPVIDNEFAEVVSSAPVSGQYITISAAGEYLENPFKRKREEAWTQITAPATADYTIDTSNAFYRKTDQNILQFKGYVITTQINPVPLVAIAQMPAGYRPSFNTFLAPIYDDGNIGVMDNASFNSGSGNITVLGQAGTVNHHLSHIQFILS